MAEDTKSDSSYSLIASATRDPVGLECPDIGSWSAPSVMAALARVVHNRQGAADPEHNRRESNQQGGLHGDLATAGPPNLPRRQNYRGSNEPTVNARGTVIPGPRDTTQRPDSARRVARLPGCSLRTMPAAWRQSSPKGAAAQIRLLLAAA